MPELYCVESMACSAAVSEYAEHCVDVEKFLRYCRACGNYERRWSCPPFEFDPMSVWRQFRTFRIFARIVTAAPGGGLTSMLRGMREEKQRLMGMLLRLERETPHSLALSAGGCDLCGGDCTRSGGMPCRRPDEMRYSIDALGGDLSKTMERYFGRPILWIQNGKAPDYLTLAGGLLVREG